MNLLCRLGIHRWKLERVLAKAHPVGTVIFLDEDVCQRCERLRNPQNVADVYNMMAMTGPGEVEIHHSVRQSTRLDE